MVYSISNQEQIQSKFKMVVVDGFIDIYENELKLNSNDWFITINGDVILTGTNRTIGININDH